MSQVSVRGEFHAKLKREAKARGISMSQLVEQAVAGCQVEVLPSPDPSGSQVFLCAICADRGCGIPSREPLGKDGAIVNVCDACRLESPRQGLNSFGGG